LIRMEQASLRISWSTS